MRLRRGATDYQNLFLRRVILLTWIILAQKVLKGAATLVIGCNHYCLLQDFAHVYCWGDNRFGQTGYPLATTAIPDLATSIELGGVQVNVSLPVAQIAAGCMHTCVVGKSGDVQCWGDNTSGQNEKSDPSACQEIQPNTLIHLDALGYSCTTAHTCTTPAIYRDSIQLQCTHYSIHSWFAVARSPTSARTPNRTPSPSSSATMSQSTTSSSSPSGSETVTTSETASNSVSLSGTGTVTPSTSESPTTSVTASMPPTSSESCTHTISRTQTSTLSPGESFSTTRTQTESNTQSITPTESLSNTATPSITPTSTLSRTRTSTTSVTSTPTPTPSSSCTPTVTFTSTRTSTTTRTTSETPSNTPSISFTSSNTATISFTPTQTHTVFPVATNGMCGANGNNNRCPEPLCCSEWGWCGVEAQYCGHGCQSLYGYCGLTSASPSPSAAATSGP